MKRIFLYFVLLLQTGIIVALVLQAHMIDDYGKVIKLRTVEQEYYYSYDGYLNQDIYIDYEINHIPKQKWGIDQSLDYNEKVYVLLEQGENGLYKVEKAGLNAFKAETNQVVLMGKYQYEDDRLGAYVVHYGIEKLNRRDVGSEFRLDQSAVVTLSIAPWGQKKIVDVTQKEKN